MDMSKFAYDAPYPEPKVEEPNRHYAELLLDDYAGYGSELTAICLYSYQHFITDIKSKEFAELIIGIAQVEMKHLDLLGVTIYLLGATPKFRGSYTTYGQYWNGYFVNYDRDLKDMIKLDIQSEKDAIRNYKKHIEMIDDKYIKKMLERIILDEEKHIKLLKDFYDKKF
ncbi:manganese catalase family protein [Caldicellulosiruptoraceae bacterium PP1]